MHAVLRSILSAAAAALCAAPALAFDTFESGHVRPLALSPDGSQLYAVNTPDDRLSIFSVGASGLTRVHEVPVGLEPVAVAARINSAGKTEVWVVNHLSDSVSIVEIDPADVTRSRVKRTLLVGDEPCDVVFAGSGGRRAFVTTARRGQQLAEGDISGIPVPAAQLTTPGLGRALVWVFDAEAVGANLGGNPLAILTLFSDAPRALAVSPSGGTVYAAAFKSGNRTTAIAEAVVNTGGGEPPPPAGATPGAPSVGLIVKWNGSQWVDELGRNWSSSVPFSLPDTDVFLIDANATPPALASAPNSVVGAGTVLFNMAVNPANGKLYVTNLDSRNEVRFEDLIPNFPTSGAVGGVRGNIAKSRITIVSGTTPMPVHLNPHIVYSVAPGPPSEIVQSEAFPLGPEFTSDGSRVFVPFFGSRKIVSYATADLEAGTVAGSELQVCRGPSGVVLDEANDRLYVMCRFDNSVGVVNDATNPALWTLADTQTVGYDAEPLKVAAGRRFLYEATVSAHGDQACASCHIFGDKDELAWDLGAPFGALLHNPNPARVPPLDANFHPMKGPMATQSLRGMAGQGPMHWRGDRTGGNDLGVDPLDEVAAFKKFNPAFQGLLGASHALSNNDLQSFADFALALEYPPNPVRRLDDTLTASQASGQTVFSNVLSDRGAIPCAFCHALPTGADGFSSFEGEPQTFKVAHLRNLYTKVGMFPAAGSQVRGFGFLHDGSVPTVNLFLQSPVFSLSATQEGQLEQFLLALDTGQKPAVGQQVTAAPANAAGATTIARIDLLAAQADAGNCDLIAKGVVDGEPLGWRYAGSGLFESDRSANPPTPTAALRALGAKEGQEITFTCVPRGSGQRLGIDRDGDGYRDGDERDLGTDPGDPSMPTQCSDRIDNDGDGLVDLGDPGCRNASAASESPSCSDGIDNDGDGLVDMDDPDCGNPWSDNESLLNGPCGLLGIECLPVLLWSTLRRRRRAVVAGDRLE